LRGLTGLHTTLFDKFHHFPGESRFLDSLELDVSYLFFLVVACSFLRPPSSLYFFFALEAYSPFKYRHPKWSSSGPFFPCLPHLYRIYSAGELGFFYFFSPFLLGRFLFFVLPPSPTQVPSPEIHVGLRRWLWFFSSRIISVLVRQRTVHVPFPHPHCAHPSPAVQRF